MAIKKKPAAKTTKIASAKKLVKKPTAKPTVKKAPKPKKAENKTKPTTASVESFINSVDDEKKRKDSFTIIKMMKELTKEEPKMWGSSIIGFGDVVITSERSGRTVDWFKMGFSPRKANLTLYLSMNIQEHAGDLKKLGKHKTGGGCLYINKLEDVDVNVLKAMMEKSLKKK